MAKHNLHSAKATRELKWAKEGYEALFSKKGKKTIDFLQDEVNQAKATLDSRTMSEEVDWIADPGTPSTRATQFLHTQTVSWQMKTMLATTIGMQG